MKREILFRGKSVNTGEWIEGDGIHYPKSINYLGTCWIDGMEDRANDWIQVDPATVGQYTGLCDKNGVRIFEGDIVDIWSAGQHCHGLVKWGQGSVSFFVEVPCTPHIWHLSGGGKNYDEETCEVIGNIHDNPELAKEESE